MKITKSRLLQIIREEVELHESNLEENTFELDEETMDFLRNYQHLMMTMFKDPSAVDDGEAFSDSADVDDDNKLSSEEMRNIIKIAINNPPVAKEDQLLTVDKPHKVVPEKRFLRQPR